MWIRNGANLYNVDTFMIIYPDGVKIIAKTCMGEKITIGEFWTKKECYNIFSSINRAFINGDRYIIIKNTRDGMKCLKTHNMKGALKK